MSETSYTNDLIRLLCQICFVENCIDFSLALIKHPGDHILEGELLGLQWYLLLETQQEETATCGSISAFQNSGIKCTRAVQ